MKWINSKEVKKITGVTNQTLYNWRKERKVKFKKISQRTILYDLDSILGNMKNENSNKQKDDLIKQEQILKEWCIKNGYKIDYIIDQLKKIQKEIEKINDNN